MENKLLNKKSTVVNSEKERLVARKPNGSSSVLLSREKTFLVKCDDGNDKERSLQSDKDKVKLRSDKKTPIAARKIVESRPRRVITAYDKITKTTNQNSKRTQTTKSNKSEIDAITSNRSNNNYQKRRNETSKLPIMMNTNGHVRNLVQKLNGSLNSGNDSAATKKWQLNSRVPSVATHDSNQTESNSRPLISTTTKVNNVATVKRTNETRIPNIKSVSDNNSKRNIGEDQLNIVGVETLYALLCNKHLALQKTYHELQKQLTKEQERRKVAEEKLQDAKLCEEHSTKESQVHVRQFQHRESQLVTKVHELQEQNELLEFRLLELEYVSQPPSNYKPDKRTSSDDFDDISDSGVISLSPCEDFFNECDNQDFKTQEDEEDDKLKNIDEVDLGEKLSKICHYLDSAMDRIVLERAIELIKQYEIRITSLETTLAHMCEERMRNEQQSEDKSKCLKLPEDYKICGNVLNNNNTNNNNNNNNSNIINNNNNKSAKVVATIPPYTDHRQVRCYSPESTDETSSSFKKLLRDVDCLQESGIFDEFDYQEERKCQATQTDSVETDSEYVPDLSTELSKLCEIKQRLEERDGRQTALLLKVLPPPPPPESAVVVDDEEMVNDHRIINIKQEERQLKQHFAFYKEQYEILREKLIVYEANDDERSKQLGLRLQREIDLTQTLKRCEEKIERLQQDKCRLEEEKCEFEEAENDARLKCQKLEVKLYALMEKKNDLQFQLQQSCRTISNLRSTVDELEKKLSDSYSRVEKSDRLINEYEERNFELEEREIEARYRLHILESAIPAMVLWHIFRIMDRLWAAMVNSRYSLDYHRSNNNNCLPDELSIVPNDDKSLSVVTDSSSSRCGEPTYDQQPNAEVVYCEVENDVRYSNDLKIKELQVKEKIYDQTLQQADEIIAAMEREYRQKLNELETLLNEKTSRLEQCEKKIKKISYEKNRENLLIDKLQGAEIEVAKLRQNIRLKDEEKLSWMAKEKNLKEEIENLNAIIVQCKETEETIKKKLEAERNVIKQQKNELEFKQSEIKDIDLQNGHKLKQLHGRISRLTKDIENQEVTNSELREEVETLENVIDELKKSLHFEKDEKEKIQIELSQELASKQKEIDELNRHSQELLASNTADEISLARENMEFGKNKRNNKENYPDCSQVVTIGENTPRKSVQDHSKVRDPTDNICIVSEQQFNPASKATLTNVQNAKSVSCAPKYPVTCNLNKPVFKRLMKSELAFNWNNTNSSVGNVNQQNS